MPGLFLRITYERICLAGIFRSCLIYGIDVPEFGFVFERALTHVYNTPTASERQESSSELAKL